MGAGEPGEGDRVEMRSYQIKSSVRLRNSTALISESPPFVTILTLTFKEASQDSDKQGIAQISFSTCQHSQIEFPILESPLLLGNACMTSSSHCKPSPPWCSTQTTGFNSPSLYILRNEVISLGLKAYNPAVT